MIVTVWRRHTIFGEAEIVEFFDACSWCEARSKMLSERYRVIPHYRDGCYITEVSGIRNYWTRDRGDHR